MGSRTMNASPTKASLGVGDTSVADGEWHHVVVTRKDTSIIQFWIDGVLDHEIEEAAAAGSIDNTTNLVSWQKPQE